MPRSSRIVRRGSYDQILYVFKWVLANRARIKKDKPHRTVLCQQAEERLGFTVSKQVMAIELAHAGLRYTQRGEAQADSPEHIQNVLAKSLLGLYEACQVEVPPELAQIASDMVEPPDGIDYSLFAEDSEDA